MAKFAEGVDEKAYRRRRLALLSDVMMTIRRSRQAISSFRVLPDSTIEIVLREEDVVTPLRSQELPLAAVEKARARADRLLPMRIARAAKKEQDE